MKLIVLVSVAGTKLSKGMKISVTEVIDTRQYKPCKLNKQGNLMKRAML